MLWTKCAISELTTALGAFKPILTGEQLQLFVDLYNLLKQGASVELGDIGPVAHQILFSTFTTPMNSRNKVDCALEQSLILSMMTVTPNHWLSASALTGMFARVQRTGFSALLHTAWHDGNAKDFALTARGDGVDDQEPDGAEEVDDDVDSRDDDELGLDLDIEAEDAEDEIHLHNFKELLGSTAPVNDHPWTDADFAKIFKGAGSQSEHDGSELADDVGMEVIGPHEGDKNLTK